MAISPSGRFVVTSNTGPGRNSLTVLERRGQSWDVRQLAPPPKNPSGSKDDDEWRGVFMGLAFAGERGVYASEGNSGRISYFEPGGDRRRFIDLNQGFGVGLSNASWHTLPPLGASMFRRIYNAQYNGGPGFETGTTGLVNSTPFGLVTTLGI